MRVQFFQEYVWGLNKSIFFFISLFIEIIDDNALFRIDLMNAVFAIGGSLEKVQCLLEIIANKYNCDNWLKRSMDSKLNTILKYSGCPTGGVRGIRCPQCHKLRSHCHVFCPICANSTDENVNKRVLLVKGCEEVDCLANAAVRKTKNIDELPLSDIKSSLCHGLSRNSTDEIIAATPLDLIYLLCSNNRDDIITNSTRTDMFLLLRYCIENNKSFYLTSAGMTCIFKLLEEDSLYDISFENLKEQLKYDHIPGCLNEYLTKLSSPSSIDCLLYGLGWSICSLLLLGQSSGEVPHEHDTSHDPGNIHSPSHESATEVHTTSPSESSTKKQSTAPPNIERRPG